LPGDALQALRQAISGGIGFLRGWFFQNALLFFQMIEKPNAVSQN